MSLLDQRIKAKSSTVEADGRVFTIRRPTDEEALKIGRDGVDMLEIVRRFTTGWDLSELDLVSSGTSEKTPFDSDLFADWVADQPQLWVPLGEAILNAYKAHAEKRDTAVKN